MGGIAGVFHPATPKPVDPARIRRMIDALAHRGPDGEGVWTAPGVGLGHRRDATGQPQPMTDDRLTVTIDGAIHNAAELRTALQAKGARFHTRGDAEVLLHGWRAWGPAMLDRLDGAFAVALHDGDAATLFLARDRLGVKPLHYVELPDGALAFASELKGLLAHPLLRRVPDLTAVEDYLAYGYVPDDTCLVAGVRKLTAGHHLLVARGRPVPGQRSWWDVDFSTRARGSAETLGEELVERMRTAVRSRMVADVPVGACLSGGLDSAAVVALMAEASPRAVGTCTIGFDGSGGDERAAARAVAARFATDHAERVVDGGQPSLETLARHVDEPLADPSALATLQLCGFVRERVAVALTGHGADEVLAGCRHHGVHVAGERVRSLLPEGFRTGFFGALGAHWPQASAIPGALRLRPMFHGLSLSGGEAYARAAAAIPPALRRALFADGARRTLSGYRPEDRVIAVMRAAPARDPLDAAQYVDLKMRLPGNTLTRIDRAAMAVGLDLRQPLLDHRLVAFAATLPPAMRLRHGRGKWLMRRSLDRYLPPDILAKPAPGVLMPVDRWFREPLAEQATTLARSGLLVETGWFDPVRLARLADDHRAGRAEHGRILWQLLMLEESVAHLFG